MCFIGYFLDGIVERNFEQALFTAPCLFLHGYGARFVPHRKAIRNGVSPGMHPAKKSPKFAGLDNSVEKIPFQQVGCRCSDDENTSSDGERYLCVP